MLKVFDERELELLIGGLSQIDVNDWRHHTVYQDGYSPTSPVDWEWVGKGGGWVVIGFWAESSPAAALSNYAHVTP